MLNFVSDTKKTRDSPGFFGYNRYSLQGSDPCKLRIYQIAKAPSINKLITLHPLHLCLCPLLGRAML